MGRHAFSAQDVIETFVRSSGPGGQNVNKVATAVHLVHRPTGTVVKCQKHRSQYLNRQQAWHMLRQALALKAKQQLLQRQQAQEKQRRQKRKRSAASKERMLEHKKKHGLKKQNRKGPSLYE